LGNLAVRSLAVFKFEKQQDWGKPANLSDSSSLEEPIGLKNLPVEAVLSLMDLRGLLHFDEFGGLIDCYSHLP
jgi:hypothetical protein